MLKSGLFFVGGCLASWFLFVFLFLRRVQRQCCLVGSFSCMLIGVALGLQVKFVTTCQELTLRKLNYQEKGAHRRNKSRVFRLLFLP